MSASTPLTGPELVSCARSNARRGVNVAADSCGYGNDVTAFEQALEDACKAMGVEVTTFAEVVDDVLDDA